MEIKIERAKTLKPKPAANTELGFGRYYTDHMFVLDWDKDQGWHDARIVPFAPIPLDPATMVLHYAQETFEGLKAYRTKDGRILLFRPEMNARRFANSNRRLCMPELSEEMFVEAIEALVSVEQDWVPAEEGTSLYIRPFMFATEAAVGVHPASSYKFVIILSPVGAYYPEGVNPVKIYVEDEYVRATKGGTGFTKCGGNYAASIAAQVKAEQLGYTQVLWLDGVERRYVEEVGTMNVMFMINDRDHHRAVRRHRAARGDPRLHHPDPEILGISGQRAPSRHRRADAGRTRRHVAGGIRHRHRRRHLPDRRTALSG